MAAILLLLIGGFFGWVYWYAVTTQSVPAAVRFIPSFSPDLPEVLLTPMTEEHPSDVDLTLADTVLHVPQQYASGVFAEPRTIRVPRAAEAGVFAAGLGKIRMMAVSPNGWPAGEGILYATEQQPGRLLAFPDRDRDGVADEVIIVVAGLQNPNGIAFHDNALWVATERRVIKYSDFDGDIIPEKFEVIVDTLPAGGGHVTRTLAFDEAGNLYVSVGSSCNVCVDDARRAAILRFNAIGENEEIFAAGSRNAVGITFGRDPWNPDQQVLFGTENGRDWLGDDLPPEEINVLRAGKHYGWPYCYADRVPDRTFSASGPDGVDVASLCNTTLSPVVKFQAHTAPLGLRFVTDTRLPQALRDTLLVALHGSWNRSVPVGHEVIRISGLYSEDGSGPRPTIAPLVDFLAKGSRDFGRPVDVITGVDGALYITDDAAGAIYRVAFPAP